MYMRCCLQVDAVRMPRSADNPHGNGFTAEVRGGACDVQNCCRTAAVQMHLQAGASVLPPPPQW
jgi:hypothetical protein